LFSDDWGFYYTSTENLKKVKVAMVNVMTLSDEDQVIIAKKVDTLLKTLEDAPKSGKWKSRAKIGTSKPWYQQVSDWE
jgi:hypothetical protein